MLEISFVEYSHVNAMFSCFPSLRCRRRIDSGSSNAHVVPDDPNYDAYFDYSVSNDVDASESVAGTLLGLSSQTNDRNT